MFNMCLKALIIAWLLSSVSGRENGSAGGGFQPTLAPAEAGKSTSSEPNPGPSAQQLSSEENRDDNDVEVAEILTSAEPDATSTPFERCPEPLPDSFYDADGEESPTYPSEGSSLDNISLELDVRRGTGLEINVTIDAERREAGIPIGQLTEEVQEIFINTEDFWLEWLAEVMESTSLDREIRREKLLNLHWLMSSEVREIVADFMLDTPHPVVFSGCDINRLRSFLYRLDRVLEWLQSLQENTENSVSVALQNLQQDGAPLQTWTDKFCDLSRRFFNTVKPSDRENRNSNFPSNNIPPLNIVGQNLGLPVSGKPQSPYLPAGTSSEETFPPRESMSIPFVDNIQNIDSEPPASGRKCRRDSEKSSDRDSESLRGIPMVEFNVSLRSPLSLQSRSAGNRDDLELEENCTSTAEGEETVEHPREAHVRDLTTIVEYMNLWAKYIWWNRVLEVVKSHSLCRDVQRERLLSLQGVHSRQVRHLLSVLEREISPGTVASCHPYQQFRFQNEINRMLAWMRRTSRFISVTYFSPNETHSCDDRALKNLRQDALERPDWLQSFSRLLGTQNALNIGASGNDNNCSCMNFKSEQQTFLKERLPGQENGTLRSTEPSAEDSPQPDREANTWLYDESEQQESMVAESGRQCATVAEECENNTEVTSTVCLTEHRANTRPSAIHPPHLQPEINNLQLETNLNSTVQLDEAAGFTEEEVQMRRLIRLVESRTTWTERTWWPMFRDVADSSAFDHGTRQERLLYLHGLLSHQARQLLLTLVREVESMAADDGCDPALVNRFTSQLDRMFEWVQSTAECISQAFFGPTPTNCHPVSLRYLRRDAVRRPNWRQRQGNRTHLTLELSAYISGQSCSAGQSNRKAQPMKEQDSPPLHRPVPHITRHPFLQPQIENMTLSLTLAPSADLEDAEYRIHIPYVQGNLRPITGNSDSQRCETSEGSENDAVPMLHQTNQTPLPQRIVTSNVAASSSLTTGREEAIITPPNESIRNLVQMLENNLVWIEHVWWPMGLEAITDTSLHLHQRKQKLLKLQGILLSQKHNLEEILNRDSNHSAVVSGSGPNEQLQFLNDLDRLMAWVDNSEIWISQTYNTLVAIDDSDAQALENVRRDAIKRSAWREVLTQRPTSFHFDDTEQSSSNVPLFGITPELRDTSAMRNPDAVGSRQPNLQLDVEEPTSRGANAFGQDEATALTIEGREDNSESQLCQDGTPHPYVDDDQRLLQNSISHNLPNIPRFDDELEAIPTLEEVDFIYRPFGTGPYSTGGAL